MLFLEVLVLSIVILIAVSIVWSTLQTGISPMMSSRKACKTMLEALGEVESGPMMDLGSGWGTLTLAIAQKYPMQQVIGYELSWFPWIISVIRKNFLGLDNLKLYRRDFQKADLREASVLFCYLYPGGMLKLSEKLKGDLMDDVVIVSNTFALPAYEPSKVSRLNDIYRTPIYVYHWTKSL